MRVIAGSLGGRSFASPGGHRTHPMSDKIRGALFNVLGDIGGLHILDAFAGSGALSIEAVSRGAARCIAIDIDKQAVRTIKDNVAALGIEGRIEVLQRNAGSWVAGHRDEFDIVLADPPYNAINDMVLMKVSRAVRPDGLYVLSYPADAPMPRLPEHTVLSTRAYGDAQLVFYRKQST